MKREQPIGWLPIDSRLVSPLFSFGRVHGIARIFLTVEMIMAVGVVAGTFVIVVFRVINLHP
ncbi:MAG TPA: hypothetical protein VJB96_04805 [Patescibacteria group bacterium]|nr:hypothetical protein [Patescibacteria group bacterium]